MDKLSISQELAINKIVDFLDSAALEFCLLGRAGTGKTFLLEKLLSHLKSRKYRIYGIASTNQAKDLMIQRLGDYCYTFTSFFKGKIDTVNGTGKFLYSESFIDQKIAPKYGKFDILIIDEASMITEQYYKFLKKFNCKKIFIGDKGQLDGIPESNEIEVFSIFDQQIDHAELIENMRTGDSNILKFINEIYDKDPEEIKQVLDSDIINKTDNQGKGVFWLPKEEDFLKKFYINSCYFRPILTYTNESRINLNTEIHFLTTGSSIYEQPYKPGTILISKVNIKSEKIYNGERFEILKHHKTYEVELKTYIVNYLFKNNIRFDDSLSIINNTILVHEYYDKHSSKLLKCLDTNYKDAFELALKLIAHKANNAKYQLVKTALWELFYQLKYSFDGLELGYCVTLHKAQGQTYQEVVINTLSFESISDNVLFKKLLYVGCSRAKDKVLLL